MMYAWPKISRKCKVSVMQAILIFAGRLAQELAWRAKGLKYSYI